MKKNIFNVLVVLLALCCLFVGCENPSNNGEKNDWEPTGPAVANWFEYTTSTPTGDGYYTKQTSIFYINTDGKIERAGSKSYEYIGTELEMIQNTLSWSICRENSNNITLNVEFNVTEPPVWADNISDNNSNDDLENEDENNQSGGNNNNNGEPDSPSEDDESEITLPTGYEWWCFEDAYLNNGRYENIYVLYNNETAVKSGIESFEFSEISFLYEQKSTSISNYLGNVYRVTNLSTLPSWCY